MSSSDPTGIRDAIERAQDAFEERGGGVPDYEEGIETDDDWKTQLTKACKLIEVADVLREQNGYYTAVIELCFGATERSIEAYAVAVTDDTLADFVNHEYSYQRAHEIGLFEESTTRDMRNLYSENRSESYYGGRQPNDRQADAMHELAKQVHSFAVDQIREGGVCICG